MDAADTWSRAVQHWVMHCAIDTFLAATCLHYMSSFNLQAEAGVGGRVQSALRYILGCHIVLP